MNLFKHPQILFSFALMIFIVLFMVLWIMRSGGPETLGSSEDSSAEAVYSGEKSPIQEVAAEMSGLELRPEPNKEQGLEKESRIASDTNTSNDASTAFEPLSAEQEVVLRDVESSISAALSGDQNEALELASFLNQCQFTFHDRTRVEQSIARAERSFAEGKPLTQFRPSSPAQQFDTLQDFESSQWDTFFRCEAARRLVNDDFWSDLEAQADAGNPVARYLFATLIRESPAAKLAFENWDEELQRREQSREYTWRNLDEREPLGLLALVELEGWGFAMRGNSISNNSVLILAAVKCGLSTPDLLQSVDQLLQMAERLEKSQPGALERLNTASDEARRMFCK